MSIKRLPQWVVTDTQKAFYDLESSTAIEQTARLYGKMQELVDDYNKFVDETNTAIDEFENSTNKNMQDFECKITKICNEYIKTMDMKIACQDRKIADAIKGQDETIAKAIEEQNEVIKETVSYMKDNISATVSAIITEMKENGELDEAILTAFENIDKKVENLYFDNVEAMKNAILQAGDTVQTLGYYNVNDGGQGLYKIREKQESDVVNNGLIHELNSGLVAELIIKEVLDIRCLGTKDQQDCTSIFKILGKEKFKNIKIIMPKETYILTDILTLTDINFEGNETTLLAESQATSREHFIRFSGNIRLKNITFQQNCKTAMCYFGDTIDSLIENCKFIVNHCETNGYVDLYTNNQNILFKNCYFDCYTVSSDNKPHAGGIWVREFKADKISKNITFENCEIKHFSKDESIAIWNWNGKVENVILDNCYIHDYEGATSPHFITLAIDEGKLINSRIERKGETSSTSDHITVLKSEFDGISYSPMVENCNFNLDTLLYTGIFQGKPFINNCKVINKKNCAINNSGGANFNSCNFIIEKFKLNYGRFFNCTFTMTNDDETIEGYNHCIQSGITLENCIFYNYIFGQMFVQILQANNSVYMKNVRFSNPNTEKLNHFVHSSAEFKMNINDCDIYKNIYTPSASGHLINCKLSQDISGDYIGNTKLNNNFVCL